MRSLTLITVFTCLGVGLFALDRATQPSDRAATKSADAFKLTEWLSASADLTVEGLVLTPSVSKEHDFRALQPADGRLRPVYGRVRQVCDGTTDQSRCWEIAYLEIDGKQVDSGVRTAKGSVPIDLGGADEAIETADSAPTDAPVSAWQVVATAIPVHSANSERSGAASIEGQTADEHATSLPEDLGAENATGQVPVPAERPAKPSADRLTGKAETPRLRIPDLNDRAEKGSVSGEPLAVTHRVDRPIVNARSGPGTSSPALGRLALGRDLSLLKTREDWGQFVVLEGKLARQVVWVAMDLLRTAR